MTVRLLALPVTQGDAFLLERGDQLVLVDGGKSKSQIRSLLRAHYSWCMQLHVLICTHNDDDHALGVIGVLEESSIDVGQVWLPIEFKEAIKSSQRIGVAETVRILREAIPGVPVESLEATDGDLDKPMREPHDWRAVEEMLSNADHDAREAINAGLVPIEPQLGIHARALVPALTRALNNRGARVKGAPRKPAVSGGTALRAMQNIAKIARAAYRRNVPVAWLRYTEDGRNLFAHGGMTALNATIVARTVPKASLLDWLRLTVQNERALVFRASIAAGADVLLCSDSRLSFATAPIGGVGVFTAPHHGAQANDTAYRYLPGNAIAVRSDRAMKPGGHRPSHAYRSHPIRYCTRCRPMGDSQTVELVHSGGAWMSVSARACSCT